MIAQEPSLLELEFGNPCDEYYHEPSCPVTGCKVETARQARKQRESLDDLERFKSSLRHPWRPNRHRLLEGIAQDSSLVYDNKSVQQLLS